MNKTNVKPSCEIAVVALDAIYPGSADGEGFWTDILAANDLLEDIPNSHWLADDYFSTEPGKKLKTWAKKGGFLSDINFDPIEFGIPPKLLSATDSVQLLSLIVAKSILSKIPSIQAEKVARSNTSIILGMAAATELVGQMSSKLQRPVWVKALREAGLKEDQVQAIAENIESHYPEWTESTFPGLLGNVVAGRIANRLDLGGSNCVVDAACASSLAAMTMAVQELQLGNSDLVITGGADALNDILMYMCFTKTPALSKSGDCRPFSDQADGTMLGEGVGMVALRRLEDAERDGDEIYAVLKGYGTSSDGKSKSVYAPVSKGQSSAIKRAYDMAQYSPQEVGLIEAHGTATTAGDLAEFGGLRLAFEDEESKNTQWCALGSVKSQIGHTKAAAGAASMFKAIHALHHKVIPPTIKVDKPGEKLDIESSPFYLNTQKRPWITSSSKRRRAGVSSFGFGGSNFHMTLEEYKGNLSPKRFDSSEQKLFLFSGDSHSQILSAMDAYDIDSQYLSYYARQSQLDFEANRKHKFGFVSSKKDFAAQLQMAKDALKTNSLANLPNSFFVGQEKFEGDIAFVFPGQGSQYLGMSGDLACHFDEALEPWNTARNIYNDYDPIVDQYVFPKPVFTTSDKVLQESALKDTSVAQAAIGLTSMGTLNLLNTLGLEAKHFAGHSYGELTALYAAGSLKSDDFIRLSLERGRLMKEAAKIPGAMTAVKASEDAVLELIKKHSLSVNIANINSPKQVVIAGGIKEVKEAESVFSEQSISYTALPVATAFHSHIVSDAVVPFKKIVQGTSIKAPKLNVYSNTLGGLYPKGVRNLKQVIGGQLAEPVQYVKQLQAMYNEGARVFIEVGPGDVLSRLNKASLPADTTVLSSDFKSKNQVSSFWKLIGQLSCMGQKLDFASLWDRFSVDRPKVYSKATVKIRGSNYGRLYPPQDISTIPRPNAETVSLSPETLEGQTELPEEEKADSPETSWGSAFSRVKQEKERVTPSKNRDQGHLMTHEESSSKILEPHLRKGDIGMTDQKNIMSMFEDMQNKLSQAHGLFQETMKGAHVEYMSHLTGSFQVLVQGGLGLEQAVLAPASSSASLPSSPQQESEAISVSAAENIQESDKNVVEPQKVVVEEPAPRAAAVASKKAEPSSDTGDDVFIKDLLAVVSEKTGYPEDMLSLDMELESGLGIDSIKRVEILSELQEKYPQLEDQDAGAMAELNTLAEIASFSNVGKKKTAGEAVFH